MRIKNLADLHETKSIVNCKQAKSQLVQRQIELRSTRKAICGSRLLDIQMLVEEEQGIQNTSCESFLSSAANKSVVSPICSR